VRLEPRNGPDKSAYFPDLVDELRPIPHDFVATGELVVLDDMGCPLWHRLQKRHVLRDPQRQSSHSICCRSMVLTSVNARCSNVKTRYIVCFS